jgi:hypothetical protein
VRRLRRAADSADPTESTATVLNGRNGEGLTPSQRARAADLRWSNRDVRFALESEHWAGKEGWIRVWTAPHLYF